MNPKLLIDAIVQQTAVLIAQLSTTAGVRAPLATIADQVFVELAREIERQGVSQKVAADMFGLAPRTYQAKVQRLEESVTEKGSSLWEAVLAHIEEHEGCDRLSLLGHFVEDDPLSIGAVLKDLCESGLLERTGSGSTARYRAVPEREAVLKAQDEQAFVTLVRMAIYRGVGTEGALVRRLGASPEAVSRAVSQLKSDGLVREDDEGRLRTRGVVIPAGAPVGWEAAVFDHYQAMVTAITRKLASAGTQSSDNDLIGGATVSFTLPADHPLRDEVRGLLKHVREEVDALRRRVKDHNRLRRQSSETAAPSEIPASGAPEEIVTFYWGQSIQEGQKK